MGLRAERKLPELPATTRIPSPSSTMDGVQNLPPHLQSEFMKKLEQMQMKESFTIYNALVERCFNTCVSSFRSRSLDKYETPCVENCAERYIKMSQRIALRFAEHQAMQQKRAADLAEGKLV